MCISTDFLAGSLFSKAKQIDFWKYGDVELNPPMQNDFPIIFLHYWITFPGKLKPLYRSVNLLEGRDSESFDR